MNHGLIPYVGAKHRLAERLVAICAGTGADLFVDVFGGSAAVMLMASRSFPKLIYNDIDGDLVNLFRVIADRVQRRELLQIMRWLPMSRKIYEDDSDLYRAGNQSFHLEKDLVKRARCTLYRHLFSFGGKIRNGGFAISKCDREHIKEIPRLGNVLRKMVKVGEIFRGACIENLDYADLIRVHGQSSRAVLFVDPPYDGSEAYYSREFRAGQHTMLAHQLEAAPAAVVCTYYSTPLIRELYPAARWDWQSITATKNSCLMKGNKEITDEFVITKRRL